MYGQKGDFFRSIDQFANLILEDVVERTFVDKYYCDVQQGFLLIRGENVELAGEIDENADTGLTQVHYYFFIFKKNSRRVILLFFLKK